MSIDTSNEQTLLLYHYDEGLSEAERAEVARLLAADPVLRARYERLQQDLGVIADGLEATAPPAFADRLHAMIDAQSEPVDAADTQPRASRSFSLFGWGVALAAALVLGIGIGWVQRGGDLVVPDLPVAVVQAPASSGAFERGLAVHLASSRQQVGRLSAETEDERALLVTNLIVQNRLYMRAAEAQGAADLARVLRAFEPVLLRMNEEGATAADVAALQEQLAFELSVMLTKIGGAESEQAGPI